MTENTLNVVFMVVMLFVVATCYGFLIHALVDYVRTRRTVRRNRAINDDFNSRLFAAYLTARIDKLLDELRKERERESAEGCGEKEKEGES